MAPLPPPVEPTLIAIDRAYEEGQGDGWRPHLGASIIGHECDRYLWLSFRWAGRNRHNGRLLRLFERGQMEEDRFIEMLRKIGAQVHHYDIETGEQYSVSACDGHFGGSLDGVALGLPEAPKTLHVLEFKTHNEKSFNALKAKGVKETKPLHWSQVQIYMYLAHLERAAYIAVNKNTDELYMERIQVDVSFAIRLIERAERIIYSTRPPSKISDDPCWYVCRLCQHAQVCHEQTGAPRNCRTCLRSSPIADGQWSCALTDEPIPLEVQRTGCPEHCYVPDLVPGEQIDVEDETVVYRLKSGEVWRDGTNDRPSAG